MFLEIGIHMLCYGLNISSIVQLLCGADMRIRKDQVLVARVSQILDLLGAILGRQSCFKLRSSIAWLRAP